VASFSERVIGAAKLDVHIYEEVEKDRTSMTQAITVVVLSAVAAGIGSMRGGFGGLIAVTLAALISWFIWGWLTYLIGTKLLPEPDTKADPGEMLRTIGFSAAPGMLRIFGFVPLLGGLVSFAASIWMLVAMVVAVRQALDYSSTRRAIGVCVIGWLVYVAIAIVITMVFGTGGAAG
jgi:hypothetical protein